MSNFPIKVGDSSGIDTYASTLISGEEQLLITRDGKQYLTKGDGTKIEVSDIIVVDALPNSQIQANKIYILSTNFSLNYYENSAWHLLGGSDQISIGNISPTDINKLWFDITTGSNPSLKYYNGTEWISASCVNVTSLNNIPIDYSGLSNGKGLFYNQVLNKWECADTTITGIVGSTQITTISDTTIASGSELVFNHPISTNIVPVIEEQIAGSSITDTHVDFSDSSKYSIQDVGKILIESNKSQLDIYTKLLMHMDDSTFKDECGHTINTTGITLNTTNKVFGNGSAYNNASGGFIIPYMSDFNSWSGDFSIDFRIKFLTIPNSGAIFGSATNGELNIAFNTGGTIGINRVGIAWDYQVSANIVTNTWYHFTICRSGTKIYFLKNGVLLGSYTPSYTYSITSNIYMFQNIDAYIDEVRLIKGRGLYAENFTSPTQAYLSPYSIANTPTYFQTTGSSNFSLTTIGTITSLTIPTTTPTNTSVKCLFSVDNKVNWLYKDVTGIHKYTGDITQDWTNYNSSSDLQTYFLNLSMSQLTTDLSSLGIIPVSLDFMWQLNTSDLNQTPSISAITMVYINAPHTEFASYGSYEETSVKFGIKKISNSQIAIKNLGNKTRTIKVNVITSA